MRNRFEAEAQPHRLELGTNGNESFSRRMRTRYVLCRLDTWTAVHESCAPLIYPIMNHTKRVWIFKVKSIPTVYVQDRKGGALDNFQRLERVQRASLRLNTLGRFSYASVPEFHAVVVLHTGFGRVMDRIRDRFSSSRAWPLESNLNFLLADANHYSKCSQHYRRHSASTCLLLHSKDQIHTNLQ
jgi:hypothetical protein